MQKATVITTAGDIFESGADVLVCPVNTRGVMGAGLAKAFAEKWPHFEYVYKLVCTSAEDEETVMIDGIMHLLSLNPADSPRILFAAATKKDWRQPSNISYVTKAAKSVVSKLNFMQTTQQSFKENPIRDIAVPALGCGLGGLQWSEVQPILKAIFGGAKVKKVYLFEPSE